MNCISLAFAICQIVVVVFFGIPTPQTPTTQPQSMIYSFINSTDIIDNNNSSITQNFFTLGESYFYSTIHHITVKENIPTRGLDTAVTVFGSFDPLDQVFVIKGTKTLNCTIILSNRKASCPIPAGTGTSQFRVDILSRNHTIVSRIHTFQYAHPVIYKVIQSQPSPTNGNLLVTIIGTNFGSDSHKVVSVFVGNSHKVFGSPQCLNAKCSKEVITFITPPGFGENGNFVVVSVNGLTSQPSGQTVLYGHPIIICMSPVLLAYSGTITLIGKNFAVSSFNTNTTVSIGEAKCTNVRKYLDHGNEIITCLIDYKAEDLNSVSITIGNCNENLSTKGTDSLYMLENPFITSGYPLIGHYTLIRVAPFPEWVDFINLQSKIESYTQKVLISNLFVIFLVLVNFILSKIRLLLIKMSRVPLGINRKVLSRGLSAKDIVVYKQRSQYRFLPFITKEVRVVKLSTLNKDINLESQRLFQFVERYFHAQCKEIVVNKVCVIFDNTATRKFQLNDFSNPMLACQAILSNHENLENDVFLNRDHSNTKLLSPLAHLSEAVNFVFKYGKQTLLLSWVHSREHTEEISVTDGLQVLPQFLVEVIIPNNKGKGKGNRGGTE